MDQQIVGNLPPSATRLAELIGLLGEAAAVAARSAARATFEAAQGQRARATRRTPSAAAPAASASSTATSATSASPASPAPAESSATAALDHSSTPMWDTLATALDQALKQPGARARLARHLGLPRQRVTDFTKRRRVPDAETTLRLLHWLASIRAGHDPSGIVPAPESARVNDGRP